MTLVGGDGDSGGALLLFDIDLTLIDSAGSGREAMNRAFEQLYGVRGAFDEMAFAGRTDTDLVREALSRHGIPADPSDRVPIAFEAAYAEHLATVLPARPGRVLPGARETVEALAGRRDLDLGLATGNLRRGAALKLAHFGLASWLSEGGFGDDDGDRARVVAIAARRFGVDGRAPSRRPVLVIGDTPLDVAAARANGFLAIGVATGFHDVPTLQRAGADLVLESLGDHLWAIEQMLALPGARAANQE